MSSVTAVEIRCLIVSMTGPPSLTKPFGFELDIIFRPWLSRKMHELSFKENSLLRTLSAFCRICFLCERFESMFFCSSLINMVQTQSENNDSLSEQIKEKLRDDRAGLTKVWDCPETREGCVRNCLEGYRQEDARGLAFSRSFVYITKYSRVFIIFIAEHYYAHVSRSGIWETHT